MLCLRLAAFNSGKDWEEEPLPYIAKQKAGKEEMVKMEETESTIDQKTEDPGMLPKKKPKSVCVICYDVTKPILNKRSQTCGSCYQAWNTGKIDHPTLGHFKPSLTKSKIKTSPIKKAKSGVKAIRPGKESPIKSTRRSYPFPDIVPLDFTNYPELKAVIFDTAQKLLLPAEHVAVSLISEGIVAKMKKP